MMVVCTACDFFRRRVAFQANQMDALLIDLLDAL
jgi:hypothetical protein